MHSVFMITFACLALFDAPGLVPGPVFEPLFPAAWEISDEPIGGLRSSLEPTAPTD